MRYSIENDTLRLTVDTHGAEAVSVIHKPTGAELLWSGDPSVWGRHAPILFPYTGKLTGGKMIAKGVEYAGGQHGFARDVEHTMTRHTADTLEFELHANPETLPKWPYAFVLRSTFVLDGETIHHTLTVENPVEEQLRFGIGYHPAFRIPFDADHTTTDYEFRFDQPESPMILDAYPNGLLTGCRGDLPYAVRRALFAEILADPDARAALRERLQKDPHRLLALPYRAGVALHWPGLLAAYTIAKQPLLQGQRS